MPLNQVTLPFPIRENGDKWEVAMSFDGGPATLVTCATKHDAIAVADAGPLIALSRTGDRCQVDRVRRCLAALERCGYQPHTSLLARQLRHFAESLPEPDDWA